MYSFAICLLLAIEHGVLVLWSHFGFRRHLRPPSPQRGNAFWPSVSHESGFDNVDDRVGHPEALALAALLWSR